MLSIPVQRIGYKKEAEIDFLTAPTQERERVIDAAGHCRGQLRCLATKRMYRKFRNTLEAR